ncbi:MAG TPA: hypothetical protein VMM55_12670 [Thermohalobaculum sp.]|nr:hypothetical protein [Thermohalobaculum sp.]
MTRGCAPGPVLAGLTLALALGLALTPLLATGQSMAPLLSAPLPPPKPAAFATPAVQLPGDGNGAAAGSLSAAPGGAEAAGAEGRPSSLLADPAFAADLGALLAGQAAALADAPAEPIRDTAPVGDPGPAGAGDGTSPAGIADPLPDAGAADAVPGDELALTEPAAAPDGLPPMQSLQPPLVWDDGPLDAAEAARLFEVACLSTLPEFAGVGAFFDALGFITVPGMRIRNHPQKQVSALATTPADVMESGVRSCAILVDGLEQARAASAVETLVAERFGEARRFETPARGIAHVVWVIDTAIGPAKISVTQSGGSSFIGATVLPPPVEAEPPAGVRTDGS